MAAPVVVPPAPAPTPEEIATAARRVLQGGEYSLDETAGFELRIVEWLGDRIRDLLEWLDELLGLDQFFSSLSVEMIYAILTVCVLVLVAILAYNAYVLYKTRRVAPEDFATLGPARNLSVDEILQDVQRLAAQGNYVDASRRLFLAGVVVLEDKRGGRVRQGLTNSEYLNSFRTPWVRENLRTFVDLINWKWYRSQSIDVDDYQRCRNAYDTIVARLEEMDA